MLFTFSHFATLRQSNLYRRISNVGMEITQKEKKENLLKTLQKNQRLL